MNIAGLEYLRVFGGVFLLAASGVLWSLLFFDKRRPVERVAFGFGFISAVMVIAVMAMSLAVPVTYTLFWLLFAIFALFPLAFLIVQHRFSFKNIDISWPERLSLIKIGILVGVLAVVFYMTLLPHFIQDYSLPFHADSWVHWAHTRAFLEVGETTFPNPFTGMGDASLAERGFHVWLGCFTWLSGVQLQSMFTVLPSIIAVFTALAAYALGRRSSFAFGVGAALFTAFVPTTLRFLGPSFLVPLSLGLFLALLSLLLIQWKDWRMYPILILILLFLTLVHPPSAVLTAMALLSYAVFFIAEKRYWRAAAITAIILVPAVVVALLMPLYFHIGVNALFGETYTSTLALVDLADYLGHLGYIVLGLFFVGVFTAFYQGGSLQRGLTLSTLAFFSVIVFYDRFSFGYPVIYDRSFTFFFLFVAMLAGYGLEALHMAARHGISFLTDRYQQLEPKKIVTAAAAIMIPVALCLGNVAVAYPQHVDEAETYYTVINEGRFKDFMWLQDNIGSYRTEYTPFSRAAVEPRYASVFSAVTGIYTLSSSFWPRYGTALDDDIKEFIADQGTDTAFLEEYNISVVYGRCQNEYCRKEHENVFLYYGVPPVANFTYIPINPAAGEGVMFISASHTRFGRIIDHFWVFGDGNTSADSVKGVRFKGEDEYIRVPSHSSLNITDAITMEAWIKLSDIIDVDDKNNWRVLFQKRGVWDIILEENRKPTWSVVINGTRHRWFSSTPVWPVDEWIHVAWTYEASTGVMEAYFDGKRSSYNVDKAGTLDTRDTPLWVNPLGGSSRGHNFPGFINDMRIYDRVLTRGEIQQNHQGNITKDGLISWWKMENPGDKFIDSVGNNTGVIHGAQKIHIAEHIFTTLGDFSVKLMVQNEDGLMDTIKKIVRVGAP